MRSCAIVQFNFSNAELLEKATQTIELNFGYKCVLENFNSVSSNKFFDPSRNQYYSTKILEEALTKFSAVYDKLIILTQFDLYVPILTFVFGEAQLNGKAAIVSTSRLHNEFYGLQRDEKILSERFKKEIMHEIGHTFGLKHCHDWFCVMHSSSAVDEVDIKGGDYCRECKNRIFNCAG